MDTLTPAKPAQPAPHCTRYLRGILLVLASLNIQSCAGLLNNPGASNSSASAAKIENFKVHIDAPANLTAGECSEAIAISLLGDLNDRAYKNPVDVPLVLDLGQAGGTKIYSTSDCASEISSVTVPQGTGFVIVYVKIEDAAVERIGVSVDPRFSAENGLESKEQKIHDVVVQPASPASVSFEFVPSSLMQGGCSPAAFKVVLKDHFGNPTLSASGETIDIAGLASSAIYSDSGCSLQIGMSGQIAIPMNSGDMTFYLKPAIGDALFNISISDGALNGQTISGITASALVPVSTTVLAAYPNHGAQWNDYLQRSLPQDLTNQSDTVCNPTAVASAESCFNGGEVRKAIVTGYNSCTGLTAYDALHAFNWKCNVVLGQAYMFSVGLKDDMHLRDLLNLNSWKPNQLYVSYNGTVVATSAAATWWTNPVQPLPANPQISDGSLTLTGPGKIFTYDDIERLTMGYNINDDKIAVVGLVASNLRVAVLRATLDTTSMNGNVDSNSGEATTGVTTRAILAAGGQNYLWIEGDLRGTLAGATSVTYGVFLFNVKHSTLRGLNVWNTQHRGVSLINSDFNRLSELRLTAAAIGGQNEAALNLFGSGGNIITKAMLSNNLGAGLRLDVNCAGNRISQIVAVNNQDVNVQMQGGYNILGFATLMNSGGGFADDGSQYTAKMQIFLMNNFDGYLEQGSIHPAVSQIVSTWTPQYQYGISFNGVTAGTVSGNIVTGQNAGSDCVVSGGSSPGLVDATCITGSPPYYKQLGPALPTTSDAAHYSNMIVNQVTGTDATNASATNGTATYSEGIDWVHFDNFYRTWGSSIVDYPISTGANAFCNSGSPGCQVFDFRIKAADTVLRNKSFRVGSVAGPVNDSFAVGSPCPNAVQSAEQIVPAAYNTSATLLNAFEILGDGIGNDDGFCNSGEDCIYAPNIGAYQGEGPVSAGTCNFTDGNGLTGIKIHAYTANGG